MPTFTQVEPGTMALIQQTPEGRILQVALTIEQSQQLQMFLAILSQSHPLVQMGEEHDLILKNNVCKKCKKL